MTSGSKLPLCLHSPSRHIFTKCPVFVPFLSSAPSRLFVNDSVIPVQTVQGMFYHLSQESNRNCLYLTSSFGYVFFIQRQTNFTVPHWYCKIRLSWRSPPISLLSYSTDNSVSICSRVNLNTIRNS